MKVLTHLEAHLDELVKSQSPKPPLAWSGFILKLKTQKGSRYPLTAWPTGNQHLRDLTLGSESSEGGLILANSKNSLALGSLISCLMGFY
jgi:hypothetical protein